MATRGIVRDEGNVSATEAMMNLDDLIAAIVAFPVADRLQIAQALWESIAAEDPPIHITDEQRAVFARRAAELEANPGIGLTWDQIKARVKGRS